MPQDAPADTAGPSSPPPQLPEGWLPQWEGVQRKWYYVQRATGKSQWEIPTEPVILTPSTTPGSIGTGPSQAPPSRPSTNSPQVSLARKSLAEKIEAAAENSRASRSLDAQLNGQPTNPISNSSQFANWYKEHGAQNLGQGYSANMAMAGENYIPNAHQEIPLANNFTGSSGYYSGNHQSHIADPLNSQWSQVPNIHAQQTSGYGQENEPRQDPYRGISMGSEQPHYLSDYSRPHLAKTQSQPVGVGAPHIPQPQWRVEQHGYTNAPRSMGLTAIPSSSNQSQPYLASYPNSQTTSDPASRPSQASNSSFNSADHSVKQSGPQAIRESCSTTQLSDAASHHYTDGFPMSRSESYQSGGVLPREGISEAGTIGDRPYPGYHSQPTAPQGQYSASNMARTESGTGFNSMVFPPAPDSHGAHYYQDPIIQAGIQQYALPKPQHNNAGRINDFSGAAWQQSQQQLDAQHQPPSTDPGRPRTASSHPQFVSGPWASSTPPQSLPGQQPPAR